jgi:hypothetical protein
MSECEKKKEGCCQEKSDKECTKDEKTCQKPADECCQNQKNA